MPALIGMDRSGESIMAKRVKQEKTSNRGKPPKQEKKREKPITVPATDLSAPPAAEAEAPAPPDKDAVAER